MRVWQQLLALSLFGFKMRAHNGSELRFVFPWFVVSYKLALNDAFSRLTHGCDNALLHTYSFTTTSSHPY